LRDLSQPEQGVESDARPGLLGKLTAREGIEHPARHRDLQSIGQADYIDFLASSPQRAEDFHICPVEGMMRILNPR
jgi:hypothetical protein